MISSIIFRVRNVMGKLKRRGKSTVNSSYRHNNWEDDWHNRAPVGIQTWQKVICHTGTLRLGSITKNGVKIILNGGGLSRDVEFFPGALILDLADGVDLPIRVEGVRLPNLMARLIMPKVLKINWRDYSVPGLTAGHWAALVQDLWEVAKAEPAQELDVIAVCQGGHGRTGTALAILGSLLGVIPIGEDPGAWVRSVYCGEAIESLSQITYIEKITGRTSKIQPQATNYKYTSSVVKKEESKK